MIDPRKIWRSGNLVIILLLAVPSVLVFLERLGYFPGDTARQVTNNRGQLYLAPDFSLADAQGNMLRLSAFRGRVVLLSFWATWCPPCLDNMPALESFYRAHRDQGLTILAVASDQQGEAVVTPFLRQHGVSFTALLDSTGEVTRMYGVSSLPTTYLLDRQGRLVTVAIGDSLWADPKSKALITSLLDGTASSSDKDQTTTAQRPSEAAEAAIQQGVR